MHVLELMQSFNESPLSDEGAERLAAVRQAAASLAAVIHQAMPESVWREEAILNVRRALMAAREAITSERTSKAETDRQRRRICDKAARSLTKREQLQLAGLLGMLPAEEKANGDS